MDDEEAIERAAVQPTPSHGAAVAFNVEEINSSRDPIDKTEESLGSSAGLTSRLSVLDAPPESLDIVFSNINYYLCKGSSSKRAPPKTGQTDHPVTSEGSSLVETPDGNDATPNDDGDDDDKEEEMPEEEEKDIQRTKRENEIKGKHIIKGISGIFLPGKVTAIMGPSGSGKTTLLDIIAGNYLTGRVTGKILVNGLGASKMRQISGFVHQEEHFLKTMTVREVIEMSAILRLSKEITPAEREARVQDVIKELNLIHCQNSKLGDETGMRQTSGGERRRAAIGMELVANPPILFLDEPTTGLDAFTAYAVIKCVRRLALQGRTIVMSIHQPNSDCFHLFDDVLLLEEGQTVYHGSAKAMASYFTSIGFPFPPYSNPADHVFMEVMGMGMGIGSGGAGAGRDGRSLKNEATVEKQTERTQYLISSWKQSDKHKVLTSRIRNSTLNPRGQIDLALHARPSIWLQFWFLIKRVLKNALRNPIVFGLRMALPIYMGLITGLIFINSSATDLSVKEQSRNKTGAIYFLCSQTFFNSFVSVLPTFFAEKHVFFHEYQGGYYGVTAYYWSKFFVELPISIFSSYLMVLIAYYMVGLNPPFSSYLLSATFAAISSMCGTSFGLLLESMFDSIEVLFIMSMVFLMPFRIYASIFVNTESIPNYLEWFKNISPIYYSLGGMLKVEFTRDFPGCVGPPQLCSGESVLTLYGLDSDLSQGMRIVYGLVLWLGVAILAYIIFFLKTIHKYKRNL